MKDIAHLKIIVMVHIIIKVYSRNTCIRKVLAVQTVIDLC